MERSARSALQQDMERLADGDRSAFHPVFVRLWPILRGFAARAAPLGEAEDVAQEALLKVFSRCAEFERGRDALSWILGITAYEIRTARKRQSRRRDAPPRDAEALAARPDPAGSPEATTIAADLERALGEALGALAPRDAETLLAYARGERSDLPATTFRKRVQRAVARLREAWRYQA